MAEPAARTVVSSVDGEALQIQADAICRRDCDFCSIRELDPGARNMTLEEISENLRYFSSARPISQLILASGEISDRPDFRDLLSDLANFAIQSITIVSRGHRWRHQEILNAAGRLPLRVVFSFDAWLERDLDLNTSGSLVSQARRTIQALLGAGIPVVSNSVLDTTFLRLLPRVAVALEALPVSGTTLTFPFPKGGVVDTPSLVPRLPEAKVGLATVVRMLGSSRALSIKGLPICYIPEYRHLVFPTRNRRYVTSAHQFESALSYIPDRLAFVKTSDCQKCLARNSCDGTWSDYLESGDFPPLAPFT